MFDPKWIRDHPDLLDKGLARRDPNASPVSPNLLAIDEKRREVIGKLQALQEKRNAVSKAVGEAKKNKDEARASALMEEVAAIKDAVPALEERQREFDKEFEDALAQIPNVPADDVPDGKDEKANVERHRSGEPPKFSFKPKLHFEIGEALGLMDFETAAKLSGARFVVLKGALARLDRALAQFMLDLHTSEHGYTEINPPLLVRDDTMFGTAQLPKFHEDQFASFPEHILQQLVVQSLNHDRQSLFRYVDKFGLDAAKKLAITNIELTANPSRFWLIPTAEVPLTNLVREEIVDEAKLPMRVTAGTPCFRAEAGAAGKDTRGMIRQHQFSKVELVSITTPEQSADEHERMTKSAEEVLKRLDLPYRVIVLSTGDMGFAAQKTYDIEVWLSGQGAYREISSCSNCGDFQARRMNARYKPKGAKDTCFVHTLNGSGVAVGRALIAVLENYQEEDGSIRVPDALKPYMGGLARIDAPK